LIDDNRVVDADIHGLDIEIRHQLGDGIKVFAGYRLQSYSDGAPKPNSLGSATRPPDRSDIRHTVSFGVTLNGDLLSKNRQEP
jgi:outer membrane receptor protein involved in Fe transport